jgi:hypothetical protein
MMPLDHAAVLFTKLFLYFLDVCGSKASVAEDAIAWNEKFLRKLFPSDKNGEKSIGSNNSVK